MLGCRFEPWGALGLLAVLCLPVSAHAQRVPSLDLRRLALSSDPRATLYLEPPATPGHLAWNVGVWGSYAHRLVVLDDEASNEVAVPVEHQFSVDYLAAIGITDRLALGVVLPTVVYQSGDETLELVTDAEPLPKSALGDLAFTVKATLVPSGDLGGFSLAALGRVTLPTGNEVSYVSEAATTGEARLLGEVSLVALALRGTAGFYGRRGPREYAGIEVQHEVPWGLGLVFRPQILGLDSAGRWQWNLEARGAIGVTPGFSQRRESPALLGISARCALGDFAVLAGAELPLSDAVGAPSVRGVLGIGYAPRFPDVDDDGVGDEDDQCVELAEDFDGFEDGDGCPDFDNDEDGVPDEQDKCPRELEDSDEFQDEDGCADLDNDRDGVPDKTDKCPNETGPAAGPVPGCPEKDSDGDSILEGSDRCPAEPEDRDGFQDEDGCPDADNDGDGALDAEDSCPAVAGPARSDPTLNGCPSPDRDGDTYDDAQDKCPDAVEDFDSVADEDGCADAGPERPLARWDITGPRRRLVLARPIRFTPSGSIEPASEPTLRAIATLLNQNPDLVLLVGAKPPGAGAEAEQTGLNRSFEIVESLRRFTHRDDAAETIAWTGVQKVTKDPGAAVGFIVLSSRRAE